MNDTTTRASLYSFLKGLAEKVTSALDTTGRSEDVCLYLELKARKYLPAGKGRDEVLVAS